jgi:hypothetical protein
VTISSERSLIKNKKYKILAKKNKSFAISLSVVFVHVVKKIRNRMIVTTRKKTGKIARKSDATINLWRKDGTMPGKGMTIPVNGVARIKASFLSCSV